MTQQPDYAAPKPHVSWPGWMVLPILWSLISPALFLLLILTAKFPAVERELPMDGRHWLVVFYASALFAIPHIFLSGWLIIVYRQSKVLIVLCVLAVLLSLASVSMAAYWVYYWGIC